MAIREPFDFPTDPTTHPDGEKYVSVADPMDSAQGRHTFYLSRRFYFTEGDYTIDVKADDAATVFIGTSQFNLQMILQVTLSAPNTAYVHIPQGDYRLDVVLQNLPEQPTPCYFTMVIKKNNGEELIYLSNKEGWLLDDQSISDEDLPPLDDYRFKLPMFTVLPNWKQGVTERLTWLTDIMSSEKDVEQRRSVRRNARRQFEASFLRQGVTRNRLDTFLVGIGAAEFMVPLWHEAVRMEDGIDMEALGVTFPDGELRYREFNSGDLVFVNNGDPTDYDILQVGDKEENRFSWAFPPPRPWPVGTRIYPMRTARLMVTPNIGNITDGVSEARIQFDLVDSYEIDAAWGAAGAGGLPYFKYSPDRAERIDAGYSRRYYTIDNLSGLPETTDHGRYTTVTLQAKLRLYGRDVAFGMRQFLQSARGRAVHFYAPSFMNDVKIVGDIPQDSPEVIIQQQGILDYMSTPQPTRILLAFQFYDGSPILYNNVTNVLPVYETDPDGSVSTPLRVVNEILVMEDPMPAISLDNLRRASFVSETRFDQDAFEIHHSTNQQAVIDMSVVLRQSMNNRVGVVA